MTPLDKEDHPHNAAESAHDVGDAWKVPRYDGGMPGFSGLTLDAADGSRWELALTLISSGEASVMLGEVEISRDVAGPDADGVIHMSVTVAENADREVGLSALLHGRQVADEAASSDERFARLLDEHGCRWEIVSNYGMGTVLLGDADRHGALVWQT